MAAVVHEPALLLAKAVEPLVCRPVEALLSMMRRDAQHLGRNERASAGRLGQHQLPARAVERHGARAAVEARLKPRRYERDRGRRLSHRELMVALARVDDGEARGQRRAIQRREQHAHRALGADRERQLPVSQLGNKTVLCLLLAENDVGSRKRSGGLEGETGGSDRYKNAHHDLTFALATEGSARRGSGRSSR